MNTNFKISAVAAAVALIGFADFAQANDISVRGRMHVDTAAYDSDVTELGSSTAVRRTRLGMSGKLTDTWSFQIEYDFAENGTSANDVYLRRSLANGTLSIGQMKVPMGLNELTSSNAITFMERASNSNITADSRRLGVRYDRAMDNVLFQSMLYTRGIGSGRSTGSDLGSDAPMGVAARLVFTPAAGDNLLHLGISAAAEDRGDFNSLRFRDRPEVRPADIRLIDTGNLSDVDSTFKVGLEAAYQINSFSIEAEYLSNSVSRNSDEDVTFDGFHVQMSYILTGEKRGYRGGNFRGVSPKGDGGAWEVAARYSQTNLSDGNVVGGEQNNITFGVNYYYTSNIRFMGNLIFSDIKDGVNGSEKPKALALRAQFAF